MNDDNMPSARKGGVVISVILKIDECERGEYVWLFLRNVTRDVIDFSVFK